VVWSTRKRLGSRIAETGSGGITPLGEISCEWMVYVPGGRDIVCVELGERELGVCDSMCASGWSFRAGGIGFI
jgi:hypothetical protein